MSFTIFLHFSRALLLLITVLMIVTWQVWTKNPRYINELDYEWQTAYVEEHEGRLKTASLLLGKDREAGIEALTELADDLRHIKKRDRLDKFKRTTLTRLMSAHAGQGDLDKALEYADEQLAFDDRDLMHIVTRALLLERIPGRAEEAEQILAELTERIPRFYRGAVAYSTLLVRRGRVAEAIDITMHAADLGLMDVPLEKWNLYWDPGGGWASKRRMTMDMSPTHKPDEYWCSVKLPRDVKGLRKFRIDLPSTASLHLVDWKIGFIAAKDGDERDHVVLIDGLEGVERISQMIEEGGGVRAEGGLDAYLSYDVPEEFAAVEGQITIRFQGTMRRSIPRAMRRLADDEELMAQVRAQFEADGRGDVFERFLVLARS
ncbi:MAG: hypothetical protein GY711_11920 [bacterium]|nr:hypothetical protein [bacterium]